MSIKKNYGLKAGSENYKAYIGPGEKYDLVSAMQFNLLTFSGLREKHYLLDIGCGSLRAGKLFIPYLIPGRYFGIEPNAWLVDEGIKNELGAEILALKKPVFNHNEEFQLSVFGRKFDFINAQSIFSHATKDQIGKCMNEANRVMNEDAFFLATFVLGENEYEGDSWVYPGCVTYTREYIDRTAAENGLCCEFIDWPHPNKQSWFIFTHIGNKHNLPEINAISNVYSLKNKLRVCEERLSRIENNPFVKFGLAIRKNLKKILPR